MAKPKQIILTEDGVITQEALVAYSQGRLSPEESVRLEKLLKDDPFAQDALEGIRSTEAPAEMKAVVVSLNTKLRERTGARETKKKGIEIHWATYAYAAVIVGVLIGLGFVMVHFIAQNDQKLALNKKAPEAEESVPVTQERPLMIADSSQIAPATSTIAVDSASTTSLNTTADAASPAAPEVAANIPGEKEKASKPVAQDQKKPEGNNISKNASSSQADAGKGLTINGARSDETQYLVNGHRVVADQKDKSLERSKEPVTIPSKTPAPVLEMSPVTASNASAKKAEPAAKAKEATNPTAASLKAARVFFDAGDFKEAGKIYSKVLSDDAGNFEAQYFGGICEFRNGKNRQAEKTFDKLISNNQYVDGSKWYKANVLLERGKKDEAKILLRELINTPNAYKDRAVKKYEEILK